MCPESVPLSPPSIPPDPPPLWSLCTSERLPSLGCLRESGASSVCPPGARWEMISGCRLQVVQRLHIHSAVTASVCTHNLAACSIITSLGQIQTVSPALQSEPWRTCTAEDTPRDRRGLAFICPFIKTLVCLTHGGCSVLCEQ